MSAVPRSLRQGAYALGETRFEVATRVVTDGGTEVWVTDRPVRSGLQDNLVYAEYPLVSAATPEVHGQVSAAVSLARQDHSSA